VIRAVEQVLKDGYRTRDIASKDTPHEKILGTEVMGNVICNNIRILTAVGSE